MAKFRVCSWLALPLAAVALGACSGTGRRNAASKASAASFPVTISGAAGTVTVPRRPLRIVSLSATATEDLYAVGAGRQVVAVDSYSTYPAQAPRTKLTESSVNVEAIAKYRPDLVVLAEDTNHIGSQLQKLAIPALIEPPATNLAAAYREIEQIGHATGHPAGATGTVEHIRSEIEATVRGTPKPRRPLRVYHELEPTFYSATSRTFVGQVYSMFGLRNIADAAHVSGPYPQLSAEYILASDPDLIVLADTVCCKQTTAAVAARAGWRNVAAVENDAVVPVNDSIASQWGPRIVIFAHVIADSVRRLEEKEAL